MNKTYSLLTVILLMLSNNLKAQSIKYYISDTLDFVDNNGLPMDKSMSSGFNCPQFNTCDLNGDGKKDLVVYDKQDGSITTYINKGGVGELNYELDNRYASYFPKFKAYSWVLMRDFNNDGLEDIFTMGESYYMIYKNISYTVSGRPEFVLLDPLKYRNFRPTGSGLEYNLLSTPSMHLPGIYDIDFDGDLDIMSYSNIGGAITLWKNFQVELNLPPDSISLYLVDLCWGFFTDYDCATYILNDCLDSNNRNYNQKRHVNGSSITLFDADNDKDIDLLIGNEGCSKLTMMYNASNYGSKTMDSFYSYDTNFVSPSNLAKVSIYPASYFLDLDNDGNRDLIYAPNSTTAQYHIENMDQIHWFKNIGTDSAPIWGQQKPLFTKELIDLGRQSSWVSYDWDGDGDQDLIAANKGNSYLSIDTSDRIFLYENIGNSTTPKFKLINQDFGGLRADRNIDLTLSIGDLDNDGKMDLVCGNDRGEILYYRNTSNTDKTLNPQFTFSNPQFQGINIDIGNYSAPAVADINKDGLLDLVIGRSDSTLSYYKNSGTLSEPVFTIVTSRFGNVKAFDSIGYQNYYDDTFGITGYFPVYEKYTYSKPVIADINGDGTLELIVSNSLGTIRMYLISENPTAQFQSIDSFYYRGGIQGLKFFKLDMGNQLALALCDLNSDSIPEIIVSNNRGGIQYLKPQFYRKGNNTGVQSLYKQHQNIIGFPNPSKDKLEFKINHDEIQTMRVINSMGQEIECNIIQKGSYIELDAINLPSGFYIIQIQTTNEEVYIGKFQIIK